MSYSNFTIAKIRSEFGLEIKPRPGLFGDAPLRAPSAWLKDTLAFNLALATSNDTEKARSELIVMPVLVELWRQAGQSFGLFSGRTFNVDRKLGLQGACDYLLSRAPSQFAIEAPVVVVVEAKNDNFGIGQPQCIAEMIAARIFNERKNIDIKDIYGCVTIGNAWQFLVLRGDKAIIDTRVFDVNEDLERILSILYAMSLGLLKN